MPEEYPKGPPLTFDRATPTPEIRDRYRIVTNGETGDRTRWKVQRRGWFYRWEDCRVAGRYSAPFFGMSVSIGIYKSEEDAIAALEDLASCETESQLRKF